jgi:hypothetical protein
MLSWSVNCDEVVGLGAVRHPRCSDAVDGALSPNRHHGDGETRQVVLMSLHFV